MANDNQTEKDINEVFEEIFLVEEQRFKEGYKEGFAVSFPERNLEAYNDGYRQGYALGAEIGYYSAVTEEYLASHQQNNLSEKVLKNLQILQRLINDFPDHNDPEVDLEKCFTDIRLMFKHVSSLLKINVPYQKSNELSF